MIKVTSENEISKIIYDRGLNSGLIAIDGASSSGKTETADALGESSNAIVVHIDKYLNANGETYIDRVQYDRLKKLITSNLGQLIFIEGICLIPILEGLNVEEVLYVYVARTSSNVEQYSDPELFDDEWLLKETPENSFEEASFSNYQDSQEAIDQQVRVYHKQYKPLLRTDVLFNKKENNA